MNHSNEKFTDKPPWGRSIGVSGAAAACGGGAAANERRRHLDTLDLLTIRIRNGIEEMSTAFSNSFG